ncbi:MAG TPA: hypothetical protein VL856_18900 [Acidimicrobiia bacterium]|jgi:hypothetical protein|nr:hypothetical protein [Acidimicrobiia bacterium]
MRRRLMLIIVAAGLLAAGTFACNGAASARVPQTARDISYPQCGHHLPGRDRVRFGVLGANGGKAYTRNRCLVAQLAWSKRLAEPPAFYANTGNPGPKRSEHWPTGQTSPRVCAAADLNSLNCSYDYGWNAALHSFTVATDAAQTLHHVARADAVQRVANVDWWLDVEILNSWQTLDNGATQIAQQRDTATLAGAVNALWEAGVRRVGIYSTAYQWNRITGGSSVTHDWFRANPVWLAGFNNHDHARRGCATTSFTGGPVAMTQYLGRDGLDADVICE